MRAWIVLAALTLVAGLTLTPNANADEQVKCFGINECSGESVCGVNKPELGIDHACAGENECKGKGWIKSSRGDCEGQGGEVLGSL